MLDATGVLKKIKKILGVKTDLELSEILGVKPNTISSWKKRNSLQYESLINLCKEHKINLNDLFYEDFKSAYSDDLDNRRVKMISAEHTVEYFLNTENVLISAPSFVFPTEQEIDIAFQLSSNNMFPTIKVTSYVLAKKIELKDLQPWHIYLFIIEKKGIFVHRFKKYSENGNLFCINDNVKYPMTEIQPEEVREVFCVRGAFLPDFKVIGDI